MLELHFKIIIINIYSCAVNRNFIQREELDGCAVSAQAKQRWSVIEWVTKHL
jgi:hypothetical protein